MSTFVNTLGCLYLLMNLSLLTLFIAENFDVVRYSVFKEQIYIRYITDIKSYQAFPDRILYPYIVFIQISGLKVGITSSDSL